VAGSGVLSRGALDDDQALTALYRPTPPRGERAVIPVIGVEAVSSAVHQCTRAPLFAARGSNSNFQSSCPSSLLSARDYSFNALSAARISSLVGRFL